MRSDFPYTRIPGTQRGLIRTSTLWEGPDHILLVRGTRFSEEYRRFYYQDVEAIVLQKCPRSGSIGGWVLNAIVCAIVVPMAFSSAYGKAVTMPLAAVLVFVLLARLVIALRLSCRCYIQTAVSREELPSLQRTWIAEKALGRLRGKIAEVQGTLPEDAASLLSVLTGDTAESGPPLGDAGLPSTDVAHQDKVNRQNAVRSVNLAIAAFVMLLADAALTFSSIGGPTIAMVSVWWRVLTGALVLSMGALTVFALLGTLRKQNLRALRNLLVITLIFEGLDVYISLMLGTFYSAEKGMVSTTITAFHAWQWVVSLDGAVCLLIGFGGLVFILLNWQNLRRGDVSQP